MPPKAAAKQAKAQDKAKQSAKLKNVDDKTFGLKNKNKSTKVQQFVEQVQKSATANPAGGRKTPAEDKKAKKKAEEERQKELNELFAQAIKQPKVPMGVDPKSILCEYFRAGQCTKGFKCKFSHDKNIERKTQKIDIFSDKREAGQEEGMDDWDQEKLESVVNQKHGAEKGASNRTDIICKFFLDAVEKKLYGWFWQCPNGKDCKYRHALPPGYVLKSQMKELLEAEAENAVPIEDEIEQERAKVDAKTPITEQVFLQWREKQKTKRAQKAEEAEAERKRRGNLTGREIFAEEGFTAEDDMGATDDYAREMDEDEAFARERAKADAEAARRRAESEASGASVGNHVHEEQPGPSGENGLSEPGPSGENGTHVSAADRHVFLDDDDDDDDDDDLGDDDDDEELEGLEASLSAAAKVS
ncbi:hypothetical protein WJX73_000378 [Symbiochloris irregularis]|uniref:C3H1-type domain-containing protein n=1 Tax=Symbiochloris irregularis TaxID=706552 RepID=A0AAW1PVI1_9CHLO